MNAKPQFLSRLESATPKPVVPQDKLDAIRKEAINLRSNMLERDQLKEKLVKLGEVIGKLEGKTLPDLMSDAGLDFLGIEAEGNYPAYDLENKPYYHASIKNEDETAPEAYAYLEKMQAGSLIKRTFSIAFGMDEGKAAKQFEAALVKLKVHYDLKLGVPWASLTAWVKNQVEVHKNVPPVRLMNGTIGKRASMKERKKK